jgi:hypothetical protein
VSRQLYPGEGAPDTHWIGGWVRPCAGLDDVEKRKFLTVPGLALRSLRRPARSQVLYRLSYPLLKYVSGDVLLHFPVKPPAARCSRTAYELPLLLVSLLTTFCSRSVGGCCLFICFHALVQHLCLCGFQ